MKREIKFRAWDKKNEVMCSEAQWLAVEFCGQIIITGPIDGGRRVKREDYELLQYTGLKDRNGLKEIYEGDILREFNKGYDGEPDSYNFFQVKFGKTPEGRYGYYLEDNCRNDLVFYDNFGELEVIGNIYENPELLALK